MRFPSEILYSFRTSQDLYPHWGALTKSRSRDKPSCTSPRMSEISWERTLQNVKSPYGRLSFHRTLLSGRRVLVAGGCRQFKRDSKRKRVADYHRSLPPPISGETMHLFSQCFPKRGSKTCSLSQGTFMKFSSEKLKGDKRSCWKIMGEQVFFKRMLWTIKFSEQFITLIIHFIRLFAYNEAHQTECDRMWWHLISLY